MPPVRGKVKKYSLEDMQQVIEAVRHGTSVAAASKQFKIPRITLLYKVKGKYEVNCPMGPQTVLTSDAEGLLVRWLLAIADAGFPATRLQLLDSVQMLMQKLNRPNKFINNRPGKKWYNSFLRRHHELSERLTQNLTKSRSELTELKLRAWFDEIKKHFETKNLGDILKDPRRIFNCDESAFFLAPKGIKCLVRKGDKATYNFISNDDKECLTCLMTANADGTIVPPMIMFKYERIPAHISSLMPLGWGIGKSESGWMTGQSFYEYIANIFFPWVVSNGIPLPVVLFVDGHSSHLTMELSNFCVENKIELVALYPNATHILQPMDVAVFHPLKSGWKRGVQRYKIENEGEKIRRENFGPLLNEVIRDTITAEILKNGFRTCGLFPFDADAVPFAKYFKTVANNNPPNLPIQNGPTTKNLKFFEDKIGPEKIEQFKQSSGIWKGDVHDTSLFLFWMQLHEEDENTSEVAEIENEKMNQVEIEFTEVQTNSKTSEHTKEVRSEYIDEMKVAAAASVSTKENTPEPSMREKTPEPSMKEKTPEPTVREKSPEIRLREKTLEPSKRDQHTPEPKIREETPEPSTSTGGETIPMRKRKTEESQLWDVPSPFKSTLFWPKPNIKQISKRLRKEKIPSVATSEQWRAYHQKKIDDRERKEREKEERKRKREEKKQEKEKLKPTSQKKRFNKNDDKEEVSSDSSIDMILDSEGEGDDWDKLSDGSSIEMDFDINDYVIVRYDHNYYPGKIIELDAENAETKVSTMMRSGIQDWKWPSHEDIMWYKNSDIIRKIKTPTQKNSRGIYAVLEMKTYHPELYK